MNDRRTDALALENDELRARLAEAEDTLAAIRSGDVDALIVGDDIYTLDSANAATDKLRKDVLAQMEDAVIAFDNEDHVVFMNPAAERQYAQTSSQALGRPRRALYEESRSHHAGVAFEGEASGSYRIDAVHRRADGVEIQAESTVSRLRDAQGKDIGYLAVVRDIGERVEAEATLHAASLALARRERQFSTLVENSPDVFARFDRQLRVTYVSPIIGRYTGLAPAEIIGKQATELGLPPERVSEWGAALAAVFRNGSVSRVRFSVARHGEERFFVSRLVPEFADDGTVESVLAIASDVTEQEFIDAALQESQARLRFTLDAAKVGDWELDVAADVARHSLRHDQCFGYAEPVPVWGLRIMLGHVHADDRERVQDDVRRALDARSDCQFECRVVWPDRSLHWIEVHASVYGGEDKPLRMVGIVFDSTARKLAEEAMRDADRRKDEFLATLAHELRNPLAPIHTALKLMQLKRDEASQEHARGVIGRQVKQMVHLVDDLLDVSRISQGKIVLRRESADVADIVRAAIETSRPLIDAGRHELSVRMPPPGTLRIDGDVTRLCQSVSNLVNNAAKYTPERGTIVVEARRDGDAAAISVQDSGVGIPAAMLPRVFDMFAQIDRSLDRSQGGLGIGLALVKRLVEMHGGSVRADSEGEGRGSRFVIRVPLSTRAAANVDAGPTQAEQAGAEAGRRLLIVDDNLDNADTLSEFFKAMGYATWTAHDGHEALHAAEACRPHVMLLDIGLPKLSGHDVARDIRAHEWGRRTLLIALSGWGQEDDRRKSREAGFDYHFVKPVDIEALSALIDRTDRALAAD